MARKKKVDDNTAIKKMNRKNILPILIFFGLVLAQAAAAHNPRIVSDIGIVQVQKPEISQAFYGELKGFYQDFKIDSDEPFNLYVGILVPDLPMIKTDMSFEVFQLTPATTSLAVLDGSIFKWTQFYEPFGGDYYWQGPEFEKDVSAGQYLIRVFNQSYQGKYSLAIGKKESFPPGEILNTFWLLPQLKKDFFARSPLTAFFNYVGIFLLAIIIFLASGGYLIWRIAKKKKQG